MDHELEEAMPELVGLRLGGCRAGHRARARAAHGRLAGRAASSPNLLLQQCVKIGDRKQNRKKNKSYRITAKVLLWVPCIGLQALVGEGGHL